MNRLRFLILAGISAIAVGCADYDAVAPATNSPKSFSVAIDDSVSVVQRSVATTATSVTRVIGVSGGVISIDDVVTLTIPVGALTQPTAITINIPAGQDVAAEFLPHGLKFRRPVSVAFNLAGTAAENAGVDDPFGGTYSSELPRNGKAKAQEAFLLTVHNKVATLQTLHFSTYEISFLWLKGFILVGG
jgi:hypothetical protein